jgi:CRP/FNR family transcriptional regulator
MNAASAIVAAVPAPAPRRDPLELETFGQELHLFRRHVRRKQYLFRAGQPLHSICLVHAGFYKTSIVSEDGREKITGFRMRGDLLGIDGLGTEAYGCDAVSLDVGEVWDIPCSRLEDIGARMPAFREHLMAALAGEIRRDWHWMLSLGTLNAEQRVAAFLLDLARRQGRLGFSENRLVLRMTRADLGNFLALQLETVTRALSHLAASGLIEVERRQVHLVRPEALRLLLSQARTCH